MAEVDVAETLAAAVGQTLPTEYLVFLDRLAARPTTEDGEGPLLEYEGRTWRPHDRARLAETIPHRRRDGAFPFAHETARHAAMLRAADASHDGEASAELAELGFTVDRLARGFCVGSDDNGDVLFVDAETGGVYLYCHDGMDLEAVAGSLTELIAGSNDSHDDHAET